MYQRKITFVLFGYLGHFRHLNQNRDKGRGSSPRDKQSRKAREEERLLDVRAHEVPKKLSESSSSTHSSSALRKGSMATLFKSISGQIQGPRRGRARSETKASRLMRSKASEDPKMAVIHSDTDTDTDNKRFGSRSLDRSRVKRNESNSSTDYVSRNNSQERSPTISFNKIYSFFRIACKLV